MKFQYIISNIIFIILVFDVSALRILNRLLNLEKIKKDIRYPIEMHKVETADHYVLRIFRFNYYKYQVPISSRPIVLLFHGLFSSSDAFLLKDQKVCLVCSLAEFGFDVWLGNARGNYYSRNNTKLPLNHYIFWKFSWHEIGYYDLPAIIDYILKKTNQTSLHYIGHSQGTTIFLVAMSTRPEYNSKIKTAHLMSPMAYMSYATDPMMTSLSKSLSNAGVINGYFEINEFSPHNSLFMRFGYKMCSDKVPDMKFCSPVAVILEGFKISGKHNLVLRDLISKTHPAGGSTNQIIHYMQLINSGLFQHFDYGFQKNLLIYNQSTPPIYNLSKVTSSIFLYFGDNDHLAAVKDVSRLVKELPNVIRNHHILDSSWSHADFIWAKNVSTIINKPILEALIQFESQNGNLEY